uniref:uncharacterized protein LOC122586058 n=1 Tax=Erigeron canadensis TaxID=72917 RepID=UPI001CB919D6|nr:uncharacterized protein LOC122586058 [Erigeron canadensis]
MLMSIFSSIDAFCAESIGRKLHVTNANINKIEQNPSSSLDNVIIKAEDGESSKQSPSSSSSTSQNVKKPTSKMKICPRFAPELDGINCFETIVPY